MRFAPRRDDVEEGKVFHESEEHESGQSSCRSFGVFLPRRSLLVFDGALYERYLHGIDATREDVIDATVANRGEFAPATTELSLRREKVRVSLTFRNVRVVRRALRLFG
jgi:alkylated DNA repair protein alkB family protein 6